MKSTDDEVEMQKASNAVEVAPVERIIRHADKNDHYREEVTAWDTNEPDAFPELPHSIPKNIERESELVEILTQEDFAPLNVPETLSKESGEKENRGGGVMSEGEDVLAKATSAKEVEITSGIETNVMSKMNTVPPPHVRESIETSSVAVEVSAPNGILYHTVSGGPETIQDVSSHEQTLHPKPLPAQIQNENSYVSSVSGYTIPSQEYTALAGGNVIEENNFFVGFSLFVIAIIGGGVTYIFFFMPEIFEQALKAISIVKDQLLGK